MARLYEWEVHLTPKEKADMIWWEECLESAKAEVARLQTNRDAVRRKAVQRARNELHKALRKALREKAGV